MDLATIIQFFISSGGLIATVALFYRMGKFQGTVDERFIAIDRRFEQIDKRFEQIDRRFDKIDERFEKVEDQLKSIKSDITKLDVRVNRVEIIVEFDFSHRKETKEPTIINLTEEQVVKVVERAMKIIEEKKA